jgi:hypothetical protein
MPRPRDPLSPEFVAAKRKLFQMLTAYLPETTEVFAD